MTLEQLAGNGAGSFAGERGIVSQVCSIDAILLGLPVFSTHFAFSGVCLDAKQSKISGEPRPPMPKRRLLYVQTDPLLAYSLQNQVDMRMRFIGVKHHRISVLEPKLLPGKIPHGE